MKELKVSFNATIRKEYKDVQMLLQEMKKYLADIISLEYPEFNQVFNVSVEEVSEK